MSKIALLMVIVIIALSACAPKTPVATEPPVVATEPPVVATEPPAGPFVFGMLLVGPYNDHGWSQAHYEAGQYVEEQTGAKMIYLENVYDGSPDHPLICV
jgi:simple sugar transport system substrate-binding protein